ncbi:hypothetical protein ACVBEH_00710 [Roseateles sp. GG27B]
MLVRSGAVALRLLPGRLLLLEGAHCSGSDSNRLSSNAAAAGFLTTADDPLLRVDACPGAPACASATVATRALARELASWLTAAESARGFTSSTVPSLHIAGCAKGCARATPAALTLVGRDGLFDLVCGGHAWDPPTATGLSRAQLPAALRAHFHHCPGLV